MLYPLMLNLEDRLALLVGGGAVATRKAGRLIEAGARIRVVSPSLSAELRRVLASPRVRSELRERPFEPRDLEGAFLVFACTDDEALNQSVLALCREEGLPAQSATGPDFGDFTVPSAIRRGQLQVAISTGGASPALAQVLRERIEELFPERYAELIDLLARVRETQLARGESSEQNAAKFRALARGPLEGAVLSGDRAAADAILRETLGEEFSLAALGPGSESGNPTKK